MTQISNPNVSASLPTLDYTIFGNVDGEQTVFFVAGWPDTHYVFRNNLISQLVENKKFRIVGISLPNYDKKFQHKHRFFGYSIPDTARMLGKTIQQVMDTSSSSSHKKPILVCHDWGSALSFELLAQLEDLGMDMSHGLFDRVVAIDVGGNVMGGDSLLSVTGIKRILFMLTYQWFIILSSALLPNRLSSYLQTKFVDFGRRPRYTDDTGEVILPHWRMAWPYLWTYIAAFLGGKRRSSAVRADGNRRKGVGPLGWFGVEGLLSQESIRPLSSPTLFIYNSVGPAFYSQRWLKEVLKRADIDMKNKSKVVSDIVPTDLGHWGFARKGEKAAKLNQRIVDFITA